MIFTEHVLLRYVQRIVGISDKYEAKNYVNNKRYKVTYKLLQLINESYILYEKFYSEQDKKQYTYYMNGNYLIVMDSVKKTVVTLYDVNMRESEEDEVDKVLQYAKSIKRNRNTLKTNEKNKGVVDNDSRKIEYAIELKKEELKELESRLEKSIRKSQGIVEKNKEIKKENKSLMGKIMYGFKQRVKV